MRLKHFVIYQTVTGSNKNKTKFFLGKSRKQMSASMNQLLQAMNRPDKGALYWDNLAVYIDTNTGICNGEKRRKKLKNLKKTKVDN